MLLWKQKQFTSQTVCSSCRREREWPKQTIACPWSIFGEEREVPKRREARTLHVPKGVSSLCLSEINVFIAGMYNRRCLQRLPRPMRLILFSHLTCSVLSFCQDLMLFHEDDPKPLVPAIPPCSVSSDACFAEGAAEVRQVQGAGKAAIQKC